MIGQNVKICIQTECLGKCDRFKLLMETKNIRENGIQPLMKETVRGYRYGQMGNSTKGNGQTAKFKDMGE